MSGCIHLKVRNQNEERSAAFQGPKGCCHSLGSGIGFHLCKVTGIKRICKVLGLILLVAQACCCCSLMIMGTL